MTAPDVVPQGTCAPRARFEADARTLSLDGEWAVRWSHSPATAPDDLADPGLDIASWDRIPVPSSWPMQGHGTPLYANKRFPFPVEPPHVPEGVRNDSRPPLRPCAHDGRSAA